MKLISTKEAKKIWDENDGTLGESLWVLSGEENEDGEPLFTTICPEDGFPGDTEMYFINDEPNKPDSDYLETHYEIVAYFYSNQENETLMEVENTQGRGGMWELAESLTNEFQKIYQNITWGEELDWMETLEKFLNERLP